MWVETILALEDRMHHPRQPGMSETSNFCEKMTLGASSPGWNGEREIGMVKRMEPCV
jgi:hypothetical protein